MSELNLPDFDASQFEAPDAPPADTPPAAPGDTPDPVAAAPAPAPATEPEPMYEVKVGGKTFKVPLSELTQGYQRTADYTRKTMALAERQKEFERVHAEHAKFAAEREQLKQFLSDPIAIKAYLEQLGGQAPDADPASPVTAAQLQQFYARQAAQQQQALDARMQQMTAELEIRQTAAQYATEIDGAVQHALSQFPELKAVRRIDRILREEVADRQPSSLEEAKQMFLSVAKEQADTLRNFAAEEKKKAAVQQAQLTKGIEPPGGTGVQPSPQRLVLGSQALRDAFEASLREANQK